MESTHFLYNWNLANILHQLYFNFKNFISKNRNCDGIEILANAMMVIILHQSNLLHSLSLYNVLLSIILQ